MQTLDRLALRIVPGSGRTWAARPFTGPTPGRSATDGSSNSRHA
ncbi:hypothetical protein [Streptomyces avidinii]|uniref:Uncharacterized protein n=1 Tax=Streptomyces avidinii TaxID=1895 RepID=A0ABS4L3U9_STRAV|nr:hypothetical protein [Streptomyces avidinii]MBP2036770.1 hypothetical protein [Streptomyces avidinii]